MLKIKEEYLNKSIIINKQSVKVCEIKESSFTYYNENGYSHIFEEVIVKKKKVVKYKATKKDTKLDDKD